MFSSICLLITIISKIGIVVSNLHYMYGSFEEVMEFPLSVCNSLLLLLVNWTAANYHAFLDSVNIEEVSIESVCSSGRIQW